MREEPYQRAVSSLSSQIKSLKKSLSALIEAVERIDNAIGNNGNEVVNGWYSGARAEIGEAKEYLKEAK